MPRTLIIGDVHGCLDELRALVKAAGVGRDDRVVLVGDLVAKGPDSQAVIQLCREEGYAAVLGNHDAAVLRARRPADKRKAPSALHRHVARTLGKADWRFLEELPLYLALDEHAAIVVHGGLLPGVPLKKQHADQLLYLRSFTADGRPSSRATEGTPWAQSWPGPEHVYFGHDALRGLQQHDHATGLDTGCVYGRELTGILLPERRLVSVPARKAWSAPGKTT